MEDPIFAPMPTVKVPRIATSILLEKFQANRNNNSDFLLFSFLFCVGCCVSAKQGTRQGMSEDWDETPQSQASPDSSGPPFSQRPTGNMLPCPLQIPCKCTPYIFFPITDDASSRLAIIQGVGARNTKLRVNGASRIPIRPQLRKYGEKVSPFLMIAPSKCGVWGS